VLAPARKAASERTRCWHGVDALSQGGKRVLLTARLYGAGGIETHILKLSQLLVENGVQVTVASRFARPDTPLVEMRKRIPIQLVSTPFAGSLKWFRASTAWALLVWPLLLRWRNFDTLCTSELSLFTNYLSNFVRQDGRVLWMTAGEPVPPTFQLNPRVGRVLTGVTVETQVHRTACKHVLGGELPLAVAPLLGHCADPPERTQRAVGDDTLRVAYLGRYDRGKGIFRLLDVWQALAIGDAQLHFYGHGSERQPLKQAIRERGLQEQVTVHGGWATAVELARIFDETDLLVLPSDSEGLPVVLLEAMAHGVPFVATDVGGVRVLAEDNPDVLVVPRSTGAIKSGIEAIVPLIRKGMLDGRRLQSYHRAHYGYSLLAQRWLELLVG
jgi:glycosyltransferase involved in cell wall biosynthesis